MELASSNPTASSKTWRMKLVQIETSGEVDELTEQHYQEALHEAAQMNGPDHPDVGEAASYLADLYMFFGRYQEAEILYRRALKIYSSVFGEDHMIYSMALRNLAEALQARGKTNDAHRLRFQARGIFG
jgi:tetratricopeptide (TPR) repeat protein